MLLPSGSLQNGVQPHSCGWPAPGDRQASAPGHPGPPLLLPRLCGLGAAAAGWGAVPGVNVLHVGAVERLFDLALQPGAHILEDGVAAGIRLHVPVLQQVLQAAAAAGTGQHQAQAAPSGGRSARHMAQLAAWGRTQLAGCGTQRAPLVSSGSAWRYDPSASAGQVGNRGAETAHPARPSPAPRPPLCTPPRGPSRLAPSPGRQTCPSRRAR